jgi:ribosomal protein S11
MRLRRKGLGIILMVAKSKSAVGKAKDLVKKAHFDIVDNKCVLMCFSSYSNTYLCLLDCTYKSIITRTAGNSKISTRNSKKEKKALHNVYKIVEGLKPYLELYSIKYLDVEFKGVLNMSYLKILKDNLESIGATIVSFRLILTTPHNGMRVRKQRRV